MADTTVTTVPLDNKGQTIWGPYWSDPNTAIIVYFSASARPVFYRTINKGASWAVTTLDSGIAAVISCWYDKETPGDTGTLVHIAWVSRAGIHFAYYITVDISDGSVGTRRTIDDTITASGFTFGNRIAITKTVGGNLIVAFETQTEFECYRSTDSGVNWVNRANFFEAASAGDWLLLSPANTGDNNDVAGVYWDRSATELSVKMYDDSANSITETLISGSMIGQSLQRHLAVALRLSDKHLLVGAHSARDSIGDDLKTWDLNINSISSPTVTAKTNIFTDQAESGEVSIIINQQNDDVYLAYLKGGTWESTVDLVFHKSTDGMGSWGAEQVYSEAAADDIRIAHGGRTITNSGGRIQWCFYNDDLAYILVNEVNDIEIAAVSAVGNPWYYYAQQAQLAGRV